MYKLAVLDDDTEFSASLYDFLHNFFANKMIDCSISLFSDIKSFNAAVADGARFDLLFLDILLHGSDNGIEYAKQLRAQNYKFEIIFITISREYAIESYEAEPLYYILKPIDPDKIAPALERFLEKHSPAYICFNMPNGVVRIRLSDIHYFEIYGHRIVVHTINGTVSGFRGSLRDIESQLPTEMFIRPHRSYIVNIESIMEITHYWITLVSGEKIPISKALYNRIQLEFVDYLDKKDLLI